MSECVEVTSEQRFLFRIEAMGKLIREDQATQSHAAALLVRKIGASDNPSTLQRAQTVIDNNDAIRIYAARLLALEDK
jgi:hypothetical protein